MRCTGARGSSKRWARNPRAAKLRTLRTNSASRSGLAPHISDQLRSQMPQPSSFSSPRIARGVVAAGRSSCPAQQQVSYLRKRTRSGLEPGSVVTRPRLKETIDFYSNPKDDNRPGSQTSLSDKSSSSSLSSSSSSSSSASSSSGRHDREIFRERFRKDLIFSWNT